MIIDFHTHIFPEKIAGKVISKLEGLSGLTAATNGTLQGLKSSMKANQITLSVIAPVLTDPHQFQSVNSYAKSITPESFDASKDTVISFGGIHPDTPDYKTSLRAIKSMGLKGIKLHPDYQQTFIDDMKYMRIIDYATEIGLVILVHAGIDIGLPEETYCTPKRAAHVLDELQPTQMVLAHGGGFYCWDDVENYLIGREVYIDTSMCGPYMPKEQMVRMMTNHGTHRYVFGSDSPWGDQGKDVAFIQSLSFSEAATADIFYKNAEKLLGLRL